MAVHLLEGDGGGRVCLVQPHENPDLRSSGKRVSQQGEGDSQGAAEEGEEARGADARVVQGMGLQPHSYAGPGSGCWSCTLLAAPP